jgi:hypothetical protein
LSDMVGERALTELVGKLVAEGALALASARDSELHNTASLPLHHNNHSNQQRSNGAE